MPDRRVVGPSRPIPRLVPDTKLADYLDSYSLDMIAPITEGPQPPAGGLLALWDEATLAELPRTVRTCAVTQRTITPTMILNALLEPLSVEEACAGFIETMRGFMTEQFDARSAEVVIRRGGLLTASVPTLEEVGSQLGVTRERVRQIEKRGEGVLRDPEPLDAKKGGTRPPRDARLRDHRAGQVQRIADRFAERVTRHPLAHTMRAWFDLHHGQPLTDTNLRMLVASEPEARCCERVLEILHYPRISKNENYWFRTQAERRACEAVLGTAEAWTGAKDWVQVVELLRARIPGVERILDLEATVRRFGEARGLGFGLDGRIVGDRSQLFRRMARKIVTYGRSRNAGFFR